MAIFAKVAQAGSFSDVARMLGQTPSSVSRQITWLENALGVQLMVRSTRKLRLTEAGREAYAHALNLLAASQEVMELGNRFVAAPQGKVCLSAPRAFGRMVLQPLMIEFLGRYPEVEVQLRVTYRLVDPFEEPADLVIRVTDQPPGGPASRTDRFPGGETA